eukprot:TRINITY_DN10021_c0_g1_i2.p1 TRINITY_DN10021_c0_g1~~TRINITY_DN10021_c0_g1_i2.p1  ORF type:complete len:418 (-),score=80.90 TRINITY_DN10021_c0_g1_i2:72-1325(-)
MAATALGYASSPEGPVKGSRRRAAMLDPKKPLSMCSEPREYRATSLEDIQHSLDDKRRGGGPRVGPFQASIPGEAWLALPKYDFTTTKRSTAFNERMHVEWENHVDRIIKNSGELPVASVVAKAGFRSCSPCCRDMLALARPTGKTFIMVDLADSDQRGTFHFVMGDKYLPVPKEACQPQELARLKAIVLDAQAGSFSSSSEIYDAVMHAGVPIDETAQALYLGDEALLPANCATGLAGEALLRVVHAEHFARLPAEYGASILRDAGSPLEQREAVLRCRLQAKEMLVTAWREHLKGSKVNLEAYADAAVLPLLPENPDAYTRIRLTRSLRLPSTAPVVPQAAKRRWGACGKKAPCEQPKLTIENLKAKTAADAISAMPNDDTTSIADASTALPEDVASRYLGDNVDFEDPDEDLIP